MVGTYCFLLCKRKIMENTKEKLHQLELLLTERKAPVLKYLNPGLSKDLIVDFFNDRNIPIKDDLVALYEWHDGTYFPVENVIQSQIELFPMGIFYSMEYMFKSKEDLMRWDYLEEGLGDLESYLPLFGSGEDDLHLLKIDTGEIYYISPAVQIVGEKEFNSLNDLLDCIIECYEENILKIDHDSGLNVDFDEFIRKKEKYL
jgi:hypothetical protein